MALKNRFKPNPKRREKTRSPFNPESWSQNTREKIAEIAKNGTVMEFQTITSPIGGVGSTIFQYIDAMLPPVASWNPPKGVSREGIVKESGKRGSGKYYIVPACDPATLSATEYSKNWREIIGIVCESKYTKTLPGGEKQDITRTFLRDTAGRRIIAKEGSMWMAKLAGMAGQTIKLLGLPMKRAFLGIPKDIEHLFPTLDDSSVKQKILDQLREEESKLGLVRLKMKDGTEEPIAANIIMGIGKDEIITEELLRSKLHKCLLRIQAGDHNENTNIVDESTAIIAARDVIRSLLTEYGGKFSWNEFESIHAAKLIREREIEYDPVIEEAGNAIEKMMQTPEIAKPTAEPTATRKCQTCGTPISRGKYCPDHRKKKS